MRFYLLIISTLFFFNAKGQNRIVERNSGRVISCDQLGCDENDIDSEYVSTSRECLNCFFYVADSLMQNYLHKILEQHKHSPKELKEFSKEQKNWEVKRRKESDKLSRQYEGGLMQMTEYVRIKLIMTKARNIELEKYLHKD